MTRLLSGTLFAALHPSACASAAAMRETQGKNSALESLKNVFAELKRSYYDRDFHGQDMEANYENARREI